MRKNLRQAAGSLLVVGLSGTELTGLERAWLKLVCPAGFILFRRNIADASQTRALLETATELAGEHALRCVDLEGGVVDRLRDALAPMPSPQSVARAARNKAKPQLAHEHGALVAQAVRAFGFNTTLAPVLDLGLTASASVMGTRTSDATPTGVIAYAREFLDGLSSHGVAGCGKHFPGLGSGTLDSHLETPSIARTAAQLLREDMVPYRELRNALPMVMINHAAYPATPGKERPASVSSYWITTMLRKRIGYRGIIFSDDMEMGGILKYMPIEEAAVEAVRAGTDLIEICHSPELILRAYEALTAEAEHSAAFARTLLDRARTTTRRRARLFPSAGSKALTARQFEVLRTRIQRFAERIEKAQPHAAEKENQPA